MGILLKSAAAFLVCAATLASAAAAPDKAAAPPRATVHLYGWADYVDPAVLDDFTQETGIDVAYDAYPSTEALDASLASGHSGYDVVIISAPALQKAIATGLLARLDKAKLPAAKGLNPDIAARLAPYDPGGLYAVNYMWFTLGLTFNADMIAARGGAALLSSWDTLFRPEALKKFADCGIEVQDTPNELFTLALHYMRLDQRMRSLVDVKRAADLLYGLRRNVKKFRAVDDLSRLASGDACLTLGWSSDTAQARRQARDAGSKVAIDYIVPKGGTVLLLDNLAIPKDAPHPEAALSLINYLMRPDIAARNTKATQFANGITAAKDFVPASILSDPSIYPDEATMKSLFAMASFNAAEQALIAREWNRVVNGDAAIAAADAKSKKDKEAKDKKDAKAKKDGKDKKDAKDAKEPKDKSAVKKTETERSRAGQDRR